MTVRAISTLCKATAAACLFASCNIAVSYRMADGSKASLTVGIPYSVPVVETAKK